MINAIEETVAVVSTALKHCRTAASPLLLQKLVQRRAGDVAGVADDHAGDNREKAKKATAHRCADGSSDSLPHAGLAVKNPPPP